MEPIQNKTTCAKKNDAVDGCINQNIVTQYSSNFIRGYGHPDFEHVNASFVVSNLSYSKDANGNYTKEQGLVKMKLGDANDPNFPGVPVFHTAGSTGITQNSFMMWYRDFEGINKTIKKKLTLTKQSDNSYQYNSSAFFPIDGEGYDDPALGDLRDPEYSGHNFHFTSHIQTYFKYRGNNEKLSFNGDDDVFVFVNGIKAIDIGGCHNPTEQSFQLSSTSTWKDTDGKSYKKNDNFDIYENGIYAINFYQAERKTGGSNFKLTLAGFLDMGTTECASICGDGIVVGNEACDLGSRSASGTPVFGDKAEWALNGCGYPTLDNGNVNPNACMKIAQCGNGVIEAGEACDNGKLCAQSPYASYEACIGVEIKSDVACSDTQCTYATCNDGNLDSYEECDCVNGTCQFNESSPHYKAGATCLPTCRISYCGDGYIDAALNEECDDGNAIDTDSCTNACTKARCGDGIISTALGEVCDDGDGENTGAYGHCGYDCSYMGPKCGDGNLDDGEQCDYGTANHDDVYNGCRKDCTWGPRCGDGIVNGYEACDLGAAKNTGAYGGCNADCTKPSYCGDGKIDDGEACDNGLKNSDTLYNGCTTKCQKGPYCGDGIVTSPYETCDPADPQTSSGCSSSCRNEIN